MSVDSSLPVQHDPLSHPPNHVLWLFESIRCPFDLRLGSTKPEEKFLRDGDRTGGEGLNAKFAIKYRQQECRKSRFAPSSQNEGICPGVKTYIPSMLLSGEEHCHGERS